MTPEAETPIEGEIESKTGPFLRFMPRQVGAIYGLFTSHGAVEGYLAAIDQSVISVANFLATVILARNVSPTELGVYGVGFTSLRLVRSVQDGLVTQPIATFGSSMDVPAFKKYASATGVIQLLLSAATACAAALGGWFLTRTGNDLAGPALFSLWGAFLWWQLQEYVRRVMYTRGDVFHAVLNTIIANAVRLALMIWWAGSGQLNGVTGLTAIAWGSLVALLPGIWQTRAYWTWQVTQLRRTWKLNWDFGRWIMGGSIANWVSVEFYPILTAGMISFAAAGAYRALQNLVSPVQLLLRATDMFLTPRAAKVYTEKGIHAMARLLRLTYIISGIPILGLLGIAILFPAPLLHLLYGDTYVPYSGAMVLMAVFYLLWYIYWPVDTALTAARFSRPIFVANLAAMLVMFTIGILFIMRWGVYGTIAGQALNAIIVAVILWTAWFWKLRQEE